MKILWINDSASFSGGAERYIYDLVNELSDHTHYLFYKFDKRVDLNFTDKFDGSFPIVELEDQIAKVEPDLIYIHNISDENIQEVVNTIKTDSIRFIHDHKLFCPREHKYTLVSNTVCTKKVGLGCLSCCMFFNNKNRKIITPGTISKWHEAIAKNNKLIVASAYMKDQLIEYGHDAEKISVKNLYSRFRLDLSKVKINNVDDKYFLYIGSLLRGKGIHLLLRSLENMKTPFKLKILTNDYFELPTKFSSDYVSYIRGAGSDVISEEIANAEAVVIPSIAPETFSLVGVEALALGTNVITSSIGGMQEWTDHLGVTLFKSSDDKDLFRVLSSFNKYEFSPFRPVTIEKYLNFFRKDILLEVL